MADNRGKSSGNGPTDREAGNPAGGDQGHVGVGNQSSAEAHVEGGTANGRHANGRTGAGSNRPLAAPDLGKLLSHGGSKEAITVTVDHGFATEYPALWAVMTANLTLEGKPRAQPDLKVTISGSIWIITLTMPEEEKVMEAESMDPTGLFHALERKLGLPEPPFRRAAKYVRKRQLAGGRKDLPNRS